MRKTQEDQIAIPSKSLFSFTCTALVGIFLCSLIGVFLNAVVCEIMIAHIISKLWRDAARKYDCIFLHQFCRLFFGAYTTYFFSGVLL